MELHFTATECHLPYGITHDHLSPNTSEHTHSALTPARGRYSIYLPRRDGRLSWPRWPVTYRDGTHRRSPIQVLTQQCTAGSQTRDLLITSRTGAKGGGARGAILPRQQKNTGEQSTFRPSKISARHCRLRQTTPGKNQNVQTCIIEYHKNSGGIAPGPPNWGVRTLPFWPIHRSPPQNKFGLTPLLCALVQYIRNSVYRSHIRINGFAYTNFTSMLKWILANNWNTSSMVR